MTHKMWVLQTFHHPSAGGGAVAEENPKSASIASPQSKPGLVTSLHRHRITYTIIGIFLALEDDSYE